MSKIQKDEDNFGSGLYKKPIKYRMSEIELIEFEKEIQQFYEEKEVKIPELKTIRILNSEKWFKYKGAKNEKGIIITNYISPEYDNQGKITTSKDCDPIIYEQCNEDLEQYYHWKGRKEFIDKKQIEGL